MNGSCQPSSKKRAAPCVRTGLLGLGCDPLIRQRSTCSSSTHFVANLHQGTNFWSYLTRPLGVSDCCFRSTRKTHFGRKIFQKPLPITENRLRRVRTWLVGQGLARGGMVGQGLAGASSGSATEPFWASIFGRPILALVRRQPRPETLLARWREVGCG